ncbi:MAG: response regulator transcription factor [Lachnospirales bacterium]
MKLLLVEDDERMAEAILELLRLEEYKVEHCKDGLSCMNAIENNVYDVIVLEIMLPKKTGFEVAREIRELGIKTPILMLTAKGDVEDKVEGLGSGADDYLLKPFLSKELLARIRALARRNFNSSNGKISFEDLSLDVNLANLCCIKNNLEVRLSEKEFKVMFYILTNQGQIISKEQLSVKIWGYEDESEYNKVEVYISFTRKKLNFINSSLKIRAVRGLGYELRYENV